MVRVIVYCATDGFLRVGKVPLEKTKGWLIGSQESECMTGIDLSWPELLLHVNHPEGLKEAGLHVPSLALRQVIGGIRHVDNMLFGSYIWGKCCLKKKMPQAIRCRSGLVP